MSIRKLHFVYNVDATPQALVEDFVHRWVAPETYPCKLCDLTYGRFVKKPGWQRFLWSLPVRSAFYTRVRFLRKFAGLEGQDFPAVFAQNAAGNSRPFISRREFEAIADLDALKLEVELRLNRSNRDPRVKTDPRSRSAKRPAP